MESRIPQSKSLGSAAPQAGEFALCASIQHYTDMFTKLLTTKYMRHKSKHGKERSNFVSVSVLDRA